MLSVESLINKKNQTHTTWVERIFNVLHEEGEDSHFAAWTMVSNSLRDLDQPCFLLVQRR